MVGLNEWGWAKTGAMALAATGMALALGTAAQADEVWTTEEYDVVYAEDRDRTAIWHYGEGISEHYDDDNVNGVIFIDGLAGVYTERGTYHGYWVQESSSRRCDTFREGADGTPTYHWGRFEITFADPDFPSRWQASFGVCDGPLRITLNGTPVTALD